MSSSSESIKVVARCRPLLPHEASISFQCVKVESSRNEILLSKGPDATADQDKSFLFDEVIDPQSSQQSVYETSAFQLIESVMEGYNGTVLAYGQTSSGKTFTMMGDPEFPELKGIIPRCFSHIMSIIVAAPDDKKYMVRCSFLEIYNEEIFDLLQHDKKITKCEIRHSPSTGFFVKDLTQIMVNSELDMMRVLTMGNKHKTMAETAMNSNSSRSHSLMIVNVESVESLENEVKPRVTQSKLNLVDLAGSERVGKSGINSDVRMKECTKINLSLSALGNVISALVEGKTAHVPYRDSKLTRILQDSLGGNTKTVMIAAFSPSYSNYNETLGTLRYATRARLIKNKPKINEDPKDALIRKYMEEIKNLKDALAKGGSPDEFMKDYKNINQILEENRVLQLSRNQLAEELKMKEELFIKGKKNSFSGIVESLQNNIVGGGGGNGNEEERKKLELARQKIRKQKKLHAQIVAQAKQKEEELLAQIDTLQSKKNDAESNQIFFHKYKNALYEIEDLKREHEYEKETLLDSIRDQQKEIEFYEEVTNNILSPEEIEKIRSHTIWNESLNKYKIPPFLFKEKTIKFPNLTYSQSQGLNNQQKQLRDLEMDFGLINEEASEDANSDWNGSPNEENKPVILPSVSSYKRLDLKLNVKPVIKSKNEKMMKVSGTDLKSIQKRDMIGFPNRMVNDLESPEMENNLDRKKSYLRTIDTVINSYNDKYGKDKIIAPQKFSTQASMSFTNFRDLEKDLDIQTIKAKRNLNTLLEPLPEAKNEEILKEIMEESILPLKTPGMNNKFTVLPSVGKYQIKSPFKTNLKSPFTGINKKTLPSIEKKLIVLKK